MPIRNPYDLACREVTNNVSVATVQGWIDEAIKYDIYLVLLFHRLEDPADLTEKYTSTNFQSIIDYVNLRKGEILPTTVSEAINYSNKMI